MAYISAVRVTGEIGWVTIGKRGRHLPFAWAIGGLSLPIQRFLRKEPPMDAITYSAARANLAKTMDRVCEDHEPIIITRNGEQSVVMVSLDDFKALEETAYLLRSPANAKRLLAAVTQLAEGKGQVRELAE